MRQGMYLSIEEVHGVDDGKAKAVAMLEGRALKETGERKNVWKRKVLERRAFK